MPKHEDLYSPVGFLGLDAIEGCQVSLDSQVGRGRGRLGSLQIMGGYAASKLVPEPRSSEF